MITNFLLENTRPFLAFRAEVARLNEIARKDLLELEEQNRQKSDALKREQKTRIEQED